MVQVFDARQGGRLTQFDETDRRADVGCAEQHQDFDEQQHKYDL
jgi:nitrous oxide reductase accessory protein NosL